MLLGNQANNNFNKITIYFAALLLQKIIRESKQLESTANSIDDTQFSLLQTTEGGGRLFFYAHCCNVHIEEQNSYCLRQAPAHSACRETKSCTVPS